MKAQSDSGNPIEAWSASDRVFKVDNKGNVYADGSYESPAADFAEMFPGANGLEPGDVLAMGRDGRVTRAGTGEDNSLAIIGVYSTQPAFLGGSYSDTKEDGHVPVAVLGVVPVKATAENGPIRPNDPLTVSQASPGYAAKAIPLFVLDNGQGIYGGGTIVGRAVQSLDEGEGRIEVLLQLH